MLTSYLRKGSTLSTGSQPSEVGMGNGVIRRGTPEGVIGTCVRANGGIRRSTPEETISTCECGNRKPNCIYIYIYMGSGKSLTPLPCQSPVYNNMV